MWDGLNSRAVMIAARPIGPAPTTTTVSPGGTWPLSTPTSYEVGRMSASISAASSLTPLRQRVQRRVGERDPHELGLGAVDEVAEDPAAAAEALSVAARAAVVGNVPQAEMQETRTRSPTARPRTPLPTSIDRADGLVAEDPSRFHLGHVALEDVQIGAADGDRVDPDDHVLRVLEVGQRDIDPRLAAGAVVHERFHRFASHRCRLNPTRSAARRTEAKGPTQAGSGAARW